MLASIKMLVLQAYSIRDAYFIFKAVHFTLHYCWHPNRPEGFQNGKHCQTHIYSGHHMIWRLISRYNVHFIYYEYILVDFHVNGPSEINVYIKNQCGLNSFQNYLFKRSIKIPASASRVVRWNVIFKRDTELCNDFRVDINPVLPLEARSKICLTPTQQAPGRK